MPVNSSKDYYAVLGVLPSIDQVALKAVYIALLKKYHPDVYNGNKAEAERITKDINEAYEILGDPDKRSEYDLLQKSNSFGNYEDQPDVQGGEYAFLNVEFENDWTTITGFYEGAKKKYDYLKTLSTSLAETYRIILVQGKMGHYFEFTAEMMVREYLSRYFGTNILVQNFALDLLNKNNKKVALELNKLVRILGTPADEHVHDFIEKFKERNGLSRAIFGFKPSDIVKMAVYNDTGTKEPLYYVIFKDRSIIGHTIEKMMYTPAAYYKFSSLEKYREALKEKFINFNNTNLDSVRIDNFLSQIERQITIKNFELSERYNF